jgi:hypothetical protein
MNKTALLATGFVGLTLVGPLQAETPANPNIAEAKAIAMEFFASLKGELGGRHAEWWASRCCCGLQCKGPGDRGRDVG